MKTADEIEVLEMKVRGLEHENRILRETLRDKYAAAALDGLVAYGWGPERLVTEKAWRIADMMLEERTK